MCEPRLVMVVLTSALKVSPTAVRSLSPRSTVGFEPALPKTAPAAPEGGVPHTQLVSRPQLAGSVEFLQVEFLPLPSSAQSEYNCPSVS